MKKILIFCMSLVVISLFFGSVNAIVSDLDDYRLNEEIENVDFTHTVFAEECTATWCPNCPFAASALYNIYSSGDYPFYYVSLVDDMNPIAKSRNKDYSFGIYPIYAFPTIYFDGGNTNFVGRMSTIEATENEYRDIIEEEGLRTPTKPIKIESSVSWDDNAKITVTLTVTNEGSGIYFGKIRSYVTEIESRWSNNDGDPYHFALLDYAINQYILLMPNSPKTITGTFDGNDNHNGNTYEDISQDNIQVVSTIFHWIPELRYGYESSQYNQKYLRFVTDQATGAIPE
jgi:thiol-disulfide isomerase/thioredoxin